MARTDTCLMRRTTIPRAQALRQWVERHQTCTVCNGARRAACYGCDIRRGGMNVAYRRIQAQAYRANQASTIRADARRAANAGRMRAARRVAVIRAREQAADSKAHRAARLDPETAAREQAADTAAHRAARRVPAAFDRQDLLARFRSLRHDSLPSAALYTIDELREVNANDQPTVTRSTCGESIPSAHTAARCTRG